MMPARRPLSPAQAFSKAAELCSRSEQAEADNRTKLKNWGISQGDADTIIKHLYEERYLDKARYAHAFVKDRFRFAGWGRIKIAYQLKLKAFESDVIEDAMLEIADDEYEALLLQLLHQKARSLKGKTIPNAKASLLRFAASRGFETNLVYRHLNSILPGCDEDDY